MYPIIFQYDNFIISSYGLMLMLAFLICNYLLKKYLISINIKGEIADDIIFYAAIGGIIGAKLYFIVENYSNGLGHENLIGLKNVFIGIFTLSFSLFSSGINQFGSGLVFLGGLIGGMISVTYYLKKNNVKWLIAADWVAPYLALGHSIGRIGCFLVGDCYGKPCNLPWSMTFENGLPPTTYAVFKNNYSEIFYKYVEPFYSLEGTDENGLTSSINLNDILIYVHPTQLYETIVYLFIFLYLIFIRKTNKINGYIMFEYLFLAGLARFFIEFLRLNDKYLFDLSGAQFISIIMIVTSTFLMYKSRKKNI